MEKKPPRQYSTCHYVIISTSREMKDNSSYVSREWPEPLRSRAIIFFKYRKSGTNRSVGSITSPFLGTCRGSSYPVQGTLYGRGCLLQRLPNAAPPSLSPFQTRCPTETPQKSEPRHQPGADLPGCVASGAACEPHLYFGSVGFL